MLSKAASLRRTPCSSVTLRNNDSHPFSRRGLPLCPLPKMTDSKRAKLGTFSRNNAASTLSVSASLTADSSSVVPPSSRPAPACLSHEIVDTFNVPGEQARVEENREEQGFLQGNERKREIETEASF